jgi:hypothetical protein
MKNVIVDAAQITMIKKASRLTISLIDKFDSRLVSVSRTTTRASRDARVP